MANLEYLHLLQQGVIQWNEWRKQHIAIALDLNGAYLHNVILSGANLNAANLSSADLSNSMLNDAFLENCNLQSALLRGSYLSYAKLRGADLSHATLRSAVLVDVDLRFADLSFADLSRANLSGSNLQGATLHGATLYSTMLNETNLDNTDLSLARVSQTVFAAADLRQTKGLVEIQHNGPSSVMLNAIQLPQALHFLRGAGLSNEWIDFWRTTMMSPIQYHSCFISYSNKDEALARRLHSDLQAHGVRCWFAPEDLKIGNNIRDHIDKAIHQQDKLLLLLSEHSILSNWVANEVESALEKEDRQQREVLFPVRVDNVVMQTPKAWAATLRRTRHISDFTAWTDPQAYQSAFDRLLRDLKQN